jgi:dsDNA-specific endonuclease/ATPase MutS2
VAKNLLDLHGYKTDEVEDAVDKFLMKLSSSGLKRARIMPGKGTGAVKAVVVKYLKLAGYHWAFEKLSNGKDNEGCLVIFLD